MFSRGSSSSISFATLTPSLVTWGAPKALPIITLRPFGPKVTLTAFARASTPLLIPSLASISNTIFLEKEKDGGGNQELIKVLSKKLEEVKSAL